MLMATTATTDEPTSQATENQAVRSNQGPAPGETPPVENVELSDAQIEDMSADEVSAYMYKGVVPERFDPSQAAAAPAQDPKGDPATPSADPASGEPKKEEPKEEPDTDQEPEPVAGDKKPRNVRVRFEEDFQGDDGKVAEYARTHKISLAAAATILGVSLTLPGQAPAPAADAPDPEPEENETVEFSTEELLDQARTATAAAEQELREAAKSYDAPKQVEAQIALAKAQREEQRLEARLEKEVAEFDAYDRQVNANIDSMMAKFPSIADQSTPLFKEYQREMAYVEKHEPGLLSNPQFPLIIAGRASDRVAPSRPAAVPPQPAPKASDPVNPAGRSTTPPEMTQAEIVKKIEDPNTSLEELQELNRKLVVAA